MICQMLPWKLLGADCARDLRVLRLFRFAQE
jgi:hypothetical protein